MNGLTLSREYFEGTAREKLKDAFPELFPRLAVGLAGNGSECFGFDDETSRDHDWGVDFYIWVTEADRGAIGDLAAWKNQLFTFFPPEYRRDRSQYGAAVNVMTCEDFFRQLIGTHEYPDDLRQWFRIPEENLAMSVNGEVFMDNAGRMTALRESFLRYFPEDYRKKKIAAKCMAIAQTGQYNHLRMAKRGEFITVNTVISRFIDSVIGLVFLLNRVYKPYYKWQSRMMRSLPILGAELNTEIDELLLIEGRDTKTIMRRQDRIEKICEALKKELQRQGLTSSDDAFFTAHGEEVQRRIEDSFIRSLPTQYE